MCAGFEGFGADQGKMYGHEVAVARKALLGHPLAGLSAGEGPSQRGLHRGYGVGSLRSRRAEPDTPRERG